jgi:hypothetical protein
MNMTFLLIFPVLFSLSMIPNSASRGEDINLPLNIIPSEYFPDKDSPEKTILLSYINSPASGDLNQLKKIFDQAYLIFLGYQRDSSGAEATAENLKIVKLFHAYVTPISYGSQQFNAMNVTYCQNHLNKMSTTEILEEMRYPIKAGYRVVAANVIRLPQEKDKAQSRQVCASLAGSLLKSISKIKNDYIQLKSWEENKMSPMYSMSRDGYAQLSFYYENGQAEFYRKDLVKTSSDDWCEIGLSIGPLEGSLSQKASPRIRYPNQGLEAKWDIRSTDKRFDKVFNQIIEDSLKPLDELEAKINRGG